jgi:hypothetical protein
VLADIEHRDHVGVREHGQRLGLAGEIRLHTATRELGPQQLERDGSPESLVAGGVDDAHPALPDAAEDPISIDHQRGLAGAEQPRLDLASQAFELERRHRGREGNGGHEGYGF